MSDILIGFILSILLLAITIGCLKGCDYYHVEAMEELKYQQYMCETKGVCIYSERRR